MNPSTEPTTPATPADQRNLRDDFALAVIGRCLDHHTIKQQSGESCLDGADEIPGQAAVDAYIIADEMLKVRTRQPPLLGKYEFEFLVQRVTESETCVMITGRSDEKLSDVEVVNRVRLAVSDWVESTVLGGELWRQSFNDLNIGDLAEHLNDAMLTALLYNKGIYHLACRSVTVAGFWHYDTILANPNEETEQ
jgi:hypothetical protein